MGLKNLSLRLAVIATHKEEDDKDDEDGDDDDELPDDDLALAAPKPRKGRPPDVSFVKIFKIETLEPEGFYPPQIP